MRRNRVRDEGYTLALSEAGWLVVRLWEHQSMDEMLETVVGALRSRGLKQGPAA